jgi:hypothetical protein
MTIAARDAQANNAIWGYWREYLFWFSAALFSTGLLIVGFTGARIVELVAEACSRVLWAAQSGEHPDVAAVFRGVLSERTRLMAMGFNAGARSA